MKYLSISILFFWVVLNSSKISAQWIQTNSPYGGNIKCLAVSGKNIFAGTGGGVGGGGIFLSTDYCRSWAPVNNGLPLLSNVNAIAISGTNIFAGINGGGVYLSTNNGSSWTAVNNGLPQYAGVFALAVSGPNIFAGLNFGGGNGSIFLSTNNGESWTSVNNGFPTNASGVECFTVSDNSIFVGSDIGGIYRSTNYGASWIYCGFRDTTIFSLTIAGTYLFAGTKCCGNQVIFRSTDNGKSWSAAGTGVTGICTALAISDTNIFAGTSVSGIFLSTNNGTSWSQINNGLPTNYWVYSLAAFPDEMGGTNLLAGNNRGVYLSTDNGNNWTEADSGLTGIGNNTLAVIGNNLFAGTTSGVFLSTNDGSNWTDVNNGLSSYSVLDAEALAVSGTNLYAAIIPYGDLPYGNGICLSTDNGTNWTRLCSNPPGGMVTSLAVGKNGTDGINFFAGTTNGIFVSTNNGVIWTKLNTGLPADSMLIQSIAVEGSTILAATNYSSVILSTDNGAHWSNAAGFPSYSSISSVLLYGMNILVAGKDGGIYLSTNNGKTWSQINLGLPNNFYTQSLTVSNTNIFVGDYIGRVWRRPISEVLSNVWQENLTIKDNGNISQSISFGQSPTATDSIDSDLGEAPLPPPPFGFDARLHLPTGDDSWKDYRLSNEDSTEWLIKFQPGDGGYPISFTWDNKQLPEGSFFLKDIITGTIVNVNMKIDSTYSLTNVGINELKIEYNGKTNNPDAVEADNDLPTVFGLSQNYPNPFNPSTVIKYGLPGTSNVNIKIYNLMGQEVECLVNERQSAGYHEVKWNASDKSSGIYFYSIEAKQVESKETFHSVKKLILLK